MIVIKGISLSEYISPIFSDKIGHKIDTWLLDQLVVWHLCELRDRQQLIQPGYEFPNQHLEGCVEL